MTQTELILDDGLSAGAALQRAIDRVHTATAIYTVADVVDGLLDAIDWPHTPARLLDPGAGDGSFLVRALARLAPAPGDIETVRRVVGVEIHPRAAAEARSRIAGLLKALGWLASDAEAAAAGCVQNRDFIADGPEPSSGPFDVIAGNPPYLRWAHMPDIFRSSYEPLVPRDARADLLHAFLERSVSMLPPKGRIAMVTADRWLINEHAAPLRARLGRAVEMVQSIRLDPTSSFYVPKSRRKNTPARVHPLALVLSAREPHSRARRPLILPLSILSASVAGANPDRPDTPRLGDVADVRLGPWLGPEGIFIMPAAEAARQFAEMRRIPVAGTSEIPSDADRLRTPLTRVAVLLDQDRDVPPTFRQHLQRLWDKIPQRARRAAENGHPPERLTWNLDQAGILIPKIGRRLRVVPLPAGVLPIQHHFAIYPRQGITLDSLRHALLAPSSQAWVTHHAKPLENGFYEFTTSLLRRLPLADL